MASASAPEFLVIGHLVQDLLEDGSWRLGGAAAYASLFAKELGLRTAVLTACADDLPLGQLLPGIEIHRVPSEHSTQMRNVYVDGRRTQWVPQRASVITPADLPAAWRDSGIVLIGPVAGEADPSLASAFSESALIGLGAQGWLREIGPDQRVRPVSALDWDNEALLRPASALFLSDEDVPLEDAPEALAEWGSIVDVLAFTRGYDGADVHFDRDWCRTDPYPAEPVDLTGAGDTFATGFLVRYAETGDVLDAARFGAAAAACVIEGIGVGGVPTRDAVEERLQRH